MHGNLVFEQMAQMQLFLIANLLIYKVTHLKSVKFLIYNFGSKMQTYATINATINFHDEINDCNIIMRCI